MDKEKNCYSCAYKGVNPGNCHIKCNYAWNKSKLAPPKADQHGINNGWYLFPFNYDPVWQEETCQAHSKEIDETMITNHDPLTELFSILK